MGSETRLSWKFSCQCCIFFFGLFLRPSRLNRTHSGMDERISSPCSSQRTKLSFIVKTDDVTSGRRGVDPHGRLWAV